MSKAFKGEDASEAPLVVPPRAPLPDGQPNYVTLRGMAALRTEHEELARERARLEGGEGSEAAPIARALLGKRAGDLVMVRTPRGEEEWEITRIAYDDAG